MGISRAVLKNDIWQRLNKSPANPGFYTDSKVNSVIQEAFDDISVEMMIADEGFAHKLAFLSPVAGMVSLAIPFDYAMLLEVSYLVGNVYSPMTFDAQWGELVWSSGSGAVQQYPARYKLIDNNLFFNPPIGVGGENFLRIEYMAYPRRFQTDGDVIPGQFDRSMYWYAVYRSCNLLAAQIKQTVDDWANQENYWRAKMIAMVNFRTREIIPIKDFE